MRENDEIRLRRMLDAARKAVSFARNRRCGDLDPDRQLLPAVVKAIEIVGEATARVSEPARQQHPDIPWEQITPCATGSFIRIPTSINLDIVWQTVQ